MTEHDLADLICEHASAHRVPAHCRPAQRGAGIEPLHRIYDLRHTFATFALRAGVFTFDLSRYMDASLTMIDRQYGQIARDGREHAIRLPDALNAPELEPWTPVDVGWTPRCESGRQRRQQNRGLSRQ